MVTTKIGTSTSFTSQHADEIAALISLAHHHSFAQAGKALRRHPSIISKRIAAMETRLGIRLVERSTRQLRLSQAALELVEQLKSALDIISTAEQRALCGAAEVAGRLRLALPAEMGRRCIAPLLPEFIKMYPKISLTADYSNRFVDIISEGYDAAIRVGELKDSRLVANKLAPHRRILCASPDYLQQFGEPQHPRELTQHNCLQFSGFKSYPEWRLFQGKQSEKIVVSGNLISNDNDTLLAAAKSDLGILCAGEWLFQQAIAEGQLIHILKDWILDGEGGVYFVRTSAKYTPASVQVFKQWISAKASSGLL
ncbi:MULTISPECIES: LysR family transcriptional regulator [unclassified Agarivorans]|uniref:LysR family transcriptional regulator n=1 Tax=unclassified Agarivorans TaxID=2636026 RepID=UPI003D7CFDF2